MPNLSACEPAVEPVPSVSSVAGLATSAAAEVRRAGRRTPHLARRPVVPAGAGVPVGPALNTRGAAATAWRTAIVTETGEHARVQVCYAPDEPLCVVQVAAGALLQPCTGDTVLIFEDETQRGWIMQVLAVCASADARVLAAPGVSTLQLRGGKRLEVHAAEFAAHCDTVTVHATYARVTVAHIVVAAQRLASAARLVQQVAGHFIQRAQTRFTRVEQEDQLEAGRIEMHAEHAVELHAPRVGIEADDTIFLDGKRVMVS